MTATREVKDDDGLVLGVTVRLLTTEEGGRTKPLGSSGGYVKGHFRPNWRLPGMVGGDQIDAVVLWFGHFPIAIGNTTRAVIVPFDPGSFPVWRAALPGDEIEMCEGHLVSGRGVVEWISLVRRPLLDDHVDRFVAWAEGGELRV